MKKTSIFDVLIVYTGSIASSASSKNLKNTTPFSLAKNREHYSQAYAYFLKTCFDKGLKAAFTTSSDIVGPGKCKTYWIYKNKRWYKKIEFGFASIIFDKFSPLKKNLKKKRDILFFDNISEPFNDPDLMTLFNDKLSTFKKLQDFSIPTVKISEKTVSLSINKLNNLILKHKNPEDFAESFVLKDRFGAGGMDIYIINTNPIVKIAQILKSLPKVSFVLQPFTNFDKGYSHKNVFGYADIRIIYSKGEIIQRYIRTAKANDFRCNEHQGGKVKYIMGSSIPKNVKLLSSKILEIIDKKDSLFALDFLVSNKGNAYLLEGNINPGIYWGINSKEDKINTKKLIRSIVKELGSRVKHKKSIVADIDINDIRPSITENIPMVI